MPYSAGRTRPIADKPTKNQLKINNSLRLLSFLLLLFAGLEQCESAGSQHLHSFPLQMLEPQTDLFNLFSCCKSHLDSG